MNQLALHTKVQNVAQKLSRVEKIILSLSTMDAQLFPQEYLDLCTQASLLSERITCMLRNIVYATSGNSRTQYLQRAASVQGIKILYTEGVLMIEFPAVIYKKPGRHSGQFLLDPINTALENFVHLNSFPKFQECTVCICHIYDSNLSDDFFFDYDNRQSKQLLDIISTHTLTDDNAILCDLYQTSVPSDRECTRVYIMQKDRFIGWLLEQKNQILPC